MNRMTLWAAVIALVAGCAADGGYPVHDNVGLEQRHAATYAPGIDYWPPPEEPFPPQRMIY